MLADLGARVIKVEPPEGDPFRAMMGGLGAARVNAGKESICVDLKTEEGRRVAHGLIARADVLIHNYRVGVPERLGIGYDEARAINPLLVYVSVNGYGPPGRGRFGQVRIRFRARRWVASSRSWEAGCPNGC